MEPGKHFLTSSEILLANEIDQKGESEEFETLVQVVGELLRRMRHLTGQAGLPRSEAYVSGQFSDVAELPPLPESGPAHQCSVNGYLWATAITAENVIQGAALGPDFNPATYEGLFLDAIAAYQDKDYRRSIIYAAISAEVALGSTIDENYERLKGALTDERYRVIELEQAGGNKVRKDPIYERLRTRSDFKALLHELSIYVFRRSLLVENGSLFASAKRLNATRNQLVHSGELTESDSNMPFPIDRKGAVSALQTAAALFSWLGLRHDFILPNVGFASFPAQGATAVKSG